MKIAASVLGCDFSNARREIERVDEAKVDVIHLDVMDGHFVPNISFGAGIIKSFRKYTKLPFEVHLMISDPRKYLKDFVDAGADTIIFHSEIDDNILEVISEIKNYKKNVGLAINPETPVDSVYPYIEYLDLVTIMTVHPGFGGQMFMKNQIYKIREIKNHILDTEIYSNLEVEVDGGININTIKFARDAGADICVSGSFLFGSANVCETVRLLKM